MSKSNTLPAPAYKPIAELAVEWGTTTRRLLTYGATKQLEIRTLANNWSSIQGELVEDGDRCEVVPEKIDYISGLLRVPEYALNQIQIEGSALCNLFSLDNGDYARLTSPVTLTAEKLFILNEEQKRFEATTDSASTSIPDYRTPLMDAMYAAISKFWLNFDKTRPPSKHEVTEWLTQKGFTQNEATSLDKIIRHPDRKKGGNYKVKKP